MTTLENHIAQNALRYPNQVAIVCSQQQLTYRALQEAIDQKVAALQTSAYRKGQIVCLRANSSTDYLVTYFALHVIGCVVAPLEKDIPDEAFQRISRELCQHSVPDDAADILYTTGTTGKSKGVIISHQTILADAENLIDGQGFSHELAFVISGPLNHIGSLSKVYPMMLLGGTIILVDGLKDLNAFFEAFRYPCRKLATFLVPASIRIILQFAADRLAALSDRIDFIETGAAAISQGDMQTLCHLLPNTRLYNTYASTETGIISTYNYNDGLCEPGCLGRAMKHSQILITDQGLIACKGKTLMSGYVGDAERTAAILRDGTLYTSDIGALDAHGRLHLKGREDDVINVGGFKVAPTEVEDAALSFPGVKDCICIPVDHIITGQALKLLVAMTDDTFFDKKALALHLKSRLASYKVPLFYCKVDSIARTFNGKLDRKYYLHHNP